MSLKAIEGARNLRAFFYEGWGLMVLIVGIDGSLAVVEGSGIELSEQKRALRCRQR
jgi:hypothetical protein